MPIAREVQAVLHDGKDERTSVVDLLTRQSSDELTGRA